jgi:hypothetical protein
MSNRNYLSRNGGRHHTDPTSSRYNSRYNQRGDPRNNRPEPNRRPTNEDDIGSLMVSIDRNLTTDGNPSQRSMPTGRIVNHTRGRRRPMRMIHQPDRNPPVNQTAWWRISIQEAGTIGKERVMSTLKTHCARHFQPYHVTIY